VQKRVQTTKKDEKERFLDAAEAGKNHGKYGFDAAIRLRDRD
jgi:hypothetical protein